MKRASILFLYCAIAIVVAAQSSGYEDTLSKRDSLRIAVQKICPVSGRELPRDKPLAVWIDSQSKEQLYVCCEKCVSETPDDKYLEKIRARQAKAQKDCLVMDNEISTDSKSQIIGGYRIFVCCPPCFKKVDKAQEKYFSKLDSLHEQFLKKE